MRLRSHPIQANGLKKRIRKMYVNANTAATLKDKSISYASDRTRWITYVKADVDEQETKVSPMMRVVDVEILLHERIRSCIRTVVAATRGIRVGHITTSDVDKRLHILIAR